MLKNRKIIKYFWLVSFIVLFGGVSFFHLWRLTIMPDGYYVDETSIGYNAALISQTGKDEHNQSFPVFFKAFGEYKNPLYIYTTAVIFKVFGISELNLRLTSFIFYMGFLAGLYFLSETIFKKKIITLFAIFAAGFLPWFFSISRISFEVISQLTVFIFALYFAYKTYETEIKKDNFLYPILTGFSGGLTVYTYTTSRFFAFVYIGLLLLVYLKKENWQKHLLAASGFLLSIIPYIYFSFQYPGALTDRFRYITFLYDASLTGFEKISLFFKYYLTYFDLNFLLFKGDPNIRHHPGDVGMIFFIVFFLSIIGLLYGIYLIIKKKNRFWLFIFLNLILAPAAAALTVEYESLRSLFMGFYVLLFACLGFTFLLKFFLRNNLLPLILIIFIFLSLESYLFLEKYFVVYPKITTHAFEGSGFKDSLTASIKFNPNQIIVSTKGNNYSTNLGFYSLLLPNKDNIPIQIGANIAQKNQCLMINSWDKGIINKDNLPIKFVSDTNKFWQVKCF
ncbi:MAG: hypothetical protein HW405_796 [Candidatus Berkelbacteria bacterium]|nr:hypothetical protein [Candidatus Berkelbacteria bacterium]